MFPSIAPAQKTHSLDGAIMSLRIEHLICIAAQTNRPKDWERIRLLTEEGEVDATLLAEICDRHGVALPASLGEN